MRLAFLHNAHIREQLLVRAVGRGMMAHGDKLVSVQYDDKARNLNCDIIGVIGVKCREWVEHCRATGKRFLYFDKGYYYPKEPTTLGQGRIVNCWRVAVDETQPLAFLQTAKCDEKRWGRLAPWPQPWRDPTPDGHIIVAASSPKYHLFNGLDMPNTYYRDIIKEIKEYTSRSIWFRPKASDILKAGKHSAAPIDDTEWKDHGPFEELCHGAHAIVTHGSNAALIGMLMGVPSIIVGNGVMRPISSTELSEIENPYLAADEQKRQLLSNLAWSQFTLREWESGSAWHHIKTTFLQ